MAKQPKSLRITRQPGQIGATTSEFSLNRVLPFYSQMTTQSGDVWRRIVANQPIASICRNTLIEYILALDWQIVTKDSSKRDDYKSEVEYYTEGLKSEFGIDYTDHIEFVGNDLLTLPFGGASEVGREYDEPTGKVVWIEPLDGATLFPTPDKEYPVGQKVPQAPVPVFFPKWAIARVLMSARPEIDKRGWGIAPPEKIYLAIEMLNRGDYYYANLLLDTPEAGILDLGDMEKEAAMEWVDGFRSLFAGISPMKIPVLYEHTTETKFIPFGRPPSELIYDSTTLKYAAIIAAGYGLTLGDIGISGGSTNGGDTMAGTIRQERKTQKTGFSHAKKKFDQYFNKFLPPYLMFKFIDANDEVTINQSRARVANAQFAQIAIESYLFTEAELRAQFIADGLVNVPMPEQPPEKPECVAPQPFVNDESRGKIVGNPVNPSMGGYGDVTTKAQINISGINAKRQLESLVWDRLGQIKITDTDVHIRKLARIMLQDIFATVQKSILNLDADEVPVWNVWMDSLLRSKAIDAPEPVVKSIAQIDTKITNVLEEYMDWWWVFDESFRVLVNDLLIGEYQVAMRDTINSIEQFAYENGYSDYPEGVMGYTLTNTQILGNIAARSKELTDLLNSGTAFYITRLLYSIIKNELANMSREELQSVTVEELLNNPAFMAIVIEEFRRQMSSLRNSRSSTIADYEIGLIDEMAVLDVFDKVGLQKKQWNTTSANPCDVCIENSAEGLVPLDFLYKSKFAGELILSPLAHPECACGLSFYAAEVEDLFKNNNYTKWKGE